VTVAISLRLGDITESSAAAIVNAANRTLLGGGGVDGAIHRRGGPAILEECKYIRRHHYPQGLPTGDAVATYAGDLAAKWVIHTVGPVYNPGDNSAVLLSRCHFACLRVADQLGAASVAFPAISTGAFGYPAELAAPVALSTVLGAETQVASVEFVLFDAETLAIFEQALAKLRPTLQRMNTGSFPVISDASDPFT
jgi:O-acetyl-ADP-ribose deacetylase